MTRFPLAPMSPLIRAMTTGLLALPLVFLLGALSAPRGASQVLFGLAGLLVVLYLAVWLYARPTAFEVTGEALAIVWPGRRRVLARRDLAGSRVVGRAELRELFGWGARIGVGGLWGGFGWAWTARRGLIDLYVSRIDWFVLVERSTGRPLLLTPERPEEFVRALSG